MYNLIKKIKKVKISPRYDLTTEDLLIIVSNCGGDPFIALNYAFKAGYIQGCKVGAKKSPSHK